MNEYKIPFFLGFHGKVTTSAPTMAEAVEKAENYLDLHLGESPIIHQFTRISNLDYTEDRRLERGGLTEYNPDFKKEADNVPYSQDHLSYLLSLLSELRGEAQAAAEYLVEQAEGTENQDEYQAIIDYLETVNVDLTDAQQTLADMSNYESE